MKEEKSGTSRARNLTVTTYSPPLVSTKVKKQGQELKAFENDIILRHDIGNIISHYGVRSVIETGTEYGGTANAFAQMVQSVVTIDVTQQCDLSQLYPNVTFIEADSSTALGYAISLIPAELRPTLFYLDAHSQDFDSACPLREELSIISGCPNPIIVIHDAQVPGHPELGFATYQGTPIGMGMIEDLLPAIYPKGCETRYNSRATGASRGVLFILPATPQS